MEKKQYIKRVISKNDGRTKDIVFTDIGERYTKEILDDLYEFEEYAFSKMSADERMEMLKYDDLLLGYFASNNSIL